LGNDQVLVTANAPETASRLDSLGIAVTPIDASEIQAADGGLTCMSILAGD
jgi:N-dimethylarginine dimethylaminohydrolase